MDLDHLKSELLEFLDRLFVQLEASNLDVTNCELDHVCWRCSSIEEYQAMSIFLTKHCRLFHKALHNKREISLYEPHKSLVYNGYPIHLIELPAPKPSKCYNSGFEHAEFVINQSLVSWQQMHPLNWDTKNLNKEINPDIRLTFGDISVKFHPYSLAYVVKHLE